MSPHCALAAAGLGRLQGGKECVRRPWPCRQRLEEAQLLDIRYRLQKVPGGSVALPVLEGKAAEQWLQDNELQGPSCRLLWIQVGTALHCLPSTGSGWWPHTVSLPQDPVPSKAASVQPPAQKLRCELRRLLLKLGESWSEELECDVPRTWQRHGDLVLLSEDSFSAALWAKLGEQSGAAHRAAMGVLLASPSAPSMAALQALCSGRRSPRLWVHSAWPSEDGCCQTRCAPPVSPCCWATTAGWNMWTMAFGRRSGDVERGIEAGRGSCS